MSYLNMPRLHFSGKYRADVSTVNNKYSNYDTENIVKIDQSWNPMGGGEWNIDASVTQVCFSTGCTPSTGVRVTGLF